MGASTTFLELTAILKLRNGISKPSREDIMRNKAIYLATLLCVPAVAALITTAPVAAADGTGSSPAAITDNASTSANCFPANDVRTAQQAGEVQSACG
jgi:hypothetical protein